MAQSGGMGAVFADARARTGVPALGAPPSGAPAGYPPAMASVSPASATVSCRFHWAGPQGSRVLSRRRRPWGIGGEGVDVLVTGAQSRLPPGRRVAGGLSQRGAPRAVGGYLLPPPCT